MAESSIEWTEHTWTLAAAVLAASAIVMAACGGGVEDGAAREEALSTLPRDADPALPWKWRELANKREQGRLSEPALERPSP